MPRTRAPKTDLEREFKAVVDKHGAKIQALLDKAQAISDTHGIPFGTYVPDAFNKRFCIKGTDAEPGDGQIHWDDASDMNSELIEYAGMVAPVDRQFWYSSTAACEIFNV